jgi:hypothetical protein
VIFKSENLRDEFHKISPHLRLILCDAEVWMIENSQQIVITSLFRTDAEQERLFNAGLSKRMSVHQYGRGADVRVTDDPGLNDKFQVWLNGKYPYDLTRPHFNTCYLHNVGLGLHFHVQTVT